MVRRYVKGQGSRRRTFAGFGGPHPLFVLVLCFTHPDMHILADECRRCFVNMQFCPILSHS